MKNMTLGFLFYSLLLISCKPSSSREADLDDSTEGDTSNGYYGESNRESYEDGEYCATIQYYYSKTGNNSAYELTVEVEDGELVKIQWPNGGWLDDTHFSPPEIDEDGSCSFTTYDGKDYDIQIKEEGICSYSSSYQKTMISVLLKKRSKKNSKNKKLRMLI